MEKKAEFGEQLSTLLMVNSFSRQMNLYVGDPNCFSLIVEKICEFMKADSCSLMLLDKEKDELWIKAAKGLPDEVIKNTRVKLGSGISGSVAKEGKTLLIDNVEADKRFKRKNRERYYTSSLLSLPLSIGGDVIGVLNINNKKDKAVFTEKDQRIIEPLIGHLAVILRNAELYEELKEANEIIKRERAKACDMERLDAFTKMAITVKHEVNNPLSSIIGTVQFLLRKKGKLDPQVLKKLQVIKKEAERISKITEQLKIGKDFRSKKYTGEVDMLEL